MSEALYSTGGLRFWNEREIEARETAIRHLRLAVAEELTRVNPAWTFHRVEGPILTPHANVSTAYDGDDVFDLAAPLAGEAHVLRPETTVSSYLVAGRLNATGAAKFPMCVWQAGKSFRRETNDGASPSRMRFNEFWQLEFQCIYKVGTLADYRAAVLPRLQAETGWLTGCGCETRIVPSDRLPAYSEQTDDIEALVGSRWIEMASVSTRIDFGPSHRVLEIAFGLDRLVSAWGAA